MNTAQFISIFNSGGNPLGPFQERVEADGGTVEGLDNMLAKYDASASWQLIPSAVKAGTAYAQRPNTSVGDLTVTRASSGTFTNSAGVVQTAASNVLRTDYRNADGTLSATGRYLLEPQRTNLVFYSAAFDDAYWTKSTITVTANSTTSPGGTLDADTVLANGGASSTRTLQSSSITVTSGSSYTLTFYAKKNTNNFIQLFTSSIFGGMFANFDLNSGVVGTLGTISGSNPTSSIIPVGNGWYRCAITLTAASGGVGQCGVYLVTSATSARNEQNTLSTSVFLWGAQLEAGAYPTTYIPTTTAAVTRLADDAIKTGVSSLIGQTEGTIFADIRYEVAQQARMAITDGTTNNWIFFAFPETGTTSRIYIRSSNVVNVDQSFSSLFTANQTYKIALAYKTGNWAFYVNGTQVASGTNSISFNGTFDRIFLNGGSSTIGGVAVYAKYNQAALFPTRLDNATLAQLTTL
jgi:hypothetical protein